MEFNYENGEEFVIFLDCCQIKVRKVGNMKRTIYQIYGNITPTPRNLLDNTNKCFNGKSRKK